MSWKRNDPDPLEIKRRKLQEQERLLAEQMARLTEELHNSGHPLPEVVKRTEPPVWRMDDAAHHREVEPTPARRRNLARQRQRDMMLFFVFGAVLLLALGLVLWYAYAHHAE